MRMSYYDRSTQQWEQLIYECNRPRITQLIQIGTKYSLYLTNRDAVCRMILVNGYLFYNGRRYTDNVSRMPKEREWGILYTKMEE